VVEVGLALLFVTLAVGQAVYEERRLQRDREAWERHFAEWVKEIRG
jgi:hypothetical protein